MAIDFESGVEIGSNEYGTTLWALKRRVASQAANSCLCFWILFFLSLFRNVVKSTFIGNVNALFRALLGSKNGVALGIFYDPRQDSKKAEEKLCIAGKHDIQVRRRKTKKRDNAKVMRWCDVLCCAVAVQISSVSKSLIWKFMPKKANKWESHSTVKVRWMAGRWIYRSKQNNWQPPSNRFPCLAPIGDVRHWPAFMSTSSLSSLSLMCSMSLDLCGQEARIQRLPMHHVVLFFTVVSPFLFGWKVTRTLKRTVGGLFIYIQT